MKTRFGITAIALAALVSAMAVSPAAFASSDATLAGCNGDAASAAKASAKAPANYDGFDRFRDQNGNPLPGWEYLFNSPG